MAPENTPQSTSPQQADSASHVSPTPPQKSATERAVEDALADAQASVARLQQEMATPAEPQAQGTEAIFEPEPENEPIDFSLAPKGIEMLSDVDLEVTIELGRTRMLIEDVLSLEGGSVIELNKLAGDPVDVYVNQRLVARGEVLVLNDNFCIRISEIVANLEEEAEEALRRQLKEAVGS